MKRFSIFLSAVILSIVTAHAQEGTATEAQLTSTATEVVASETNSRFLPTTRRIDRNVDNNKFVYRGEVMLGLAASYGTLKATDADLMLFFDQINVGLRRTTIKPFVAYAYRDNRAIGLRFGYEYIDGNLGNVALNLGSAADLSFSIADLNLRSESYSWSLFHRNYMGLDRRGIVGIILESELMVKTGTSSFGIGSGDGASYSKNRNFAARLNFNPGIAVYIFPEVCVTATVGIGGLYYNQIRQQDIYGQELGRRDRSGLQFKFNVADIQIGIVAHLWNKKRE